MEHALLDTSRHADDTSTYYGECNECGDGYYKVANPATVSTVAGVAPARPGDTEYLCVACTCSNGVRVTDTACTQNDQC